MPDITFAFSPEWLRSLWSLEDFELNVSVIAATASTWATVILPSTKAIVPQEESHV